MEDAPEQIQNLVREATPAEMAERLGTIAKLADALTDFLSGEGWSLAYGIRQIAEGKQTPAEVTAELEEMDF